MHRKPLLDRNLFYCNRNRFSVVNEAEFPPLFFLLSQFPLVPSVWLRPQAALDARGSLLREVLAGRFSSLNVSR